jgi:ERCC4-type nuclease
VIAKRDRQGIKPITARVAAQKVTPSEAVLMSLPGIGYERAKELLAAFAGVPILALVWLTDIHAIGDVSNIGKATKRNVRKALGMTDEMELTVITAQCPVSLKATVLVDAADPLASSLVSAL